MKLAETISIRGHSRAVNRITYLLATGPACLFALADKSIALILQAWAPGFDPFAAGVSWSNLGLFKRSIIVIHFSIVMILILLSITQRGN